ncbi:unnamed protein product [Linum tenue]|uniref:Uncharacterized protein n=1 Tax=Linum tenue TaxID=586396 RepID=A0AAV0QQ24_9ROSI|nr:unnamed protein product [Linum tenue]
MDRFLVFAGQDEAIAHQARDFSMWLIPGLFGAAILKPTTRFLQTQSVIFPMLLSSSLVLCFHVVACWTLVYKLGIGYVGAAMAISFSTWLNVLLLACYVRLSPVCERTRGDLTGEAFRGVKQFFRLGISSALMVCLKWWSMELLILLSGLLSNPKLETSVLSICLSISTLHFTVPYGLGAAVSTRVSNELGGGRPQLARTAVVVATFLAFTESVIVIAVLFFCRRFVGYAFSRDAHIVRVARGCGWQHVGAYINLGSFYLVGLPLGCVLGFVAHLKGKGLWVGIVAGSLVQAASLSIFTACLDWEKQVSSWESNMSNFTLVLLAFIFMVQFEVLSLIVML